MKKLIPTLLTWLALAPYAVTAATLDIYFIDVEGGQATLVVTPARETLLIDAGWPGAGTFESKAGPAKTARDAQRIVAAARDAGVTTIDYLFITHFHRDHIGGVSELAQLLPIETFVDHGNPLPPDKGIGFLDTHQFRLLDTHQFREARGIGARPLGCWPWSTVWPCGSWTGIESRASIQDINIGDWREGLPRDLP